MAILKEVTLNNGIKLSYHRIVGINNITNTRTILQVRSYLTSDTREIEKNTPLGQPLNVFTNTEFIEKDYIENYTIQNAYNYIKSLPKYENATDC